MAKTFEYRVLDDEFASDDELIRELNELGREGWFVANGSFGDRREQYSSTDIEWSVVCKMLLVREK